MATKKKPVANKKAAARGGSSAWESQLAQEAEKTRGAAAASALKGGGAPRLGIRGGVLTLMGKEVKHNKLQAVIVDFALENAFYEGTYDENNPVPPSCYALGRDEESLEPSEKASDPQNEQCSVCPMNEFGSADTGRGKACKNSYRILLWVPEADEDDGPPTLVMLTAKFTVLQNLPDFVDSCVNDLRRPYWSVLAEITTSPHRKYSFTLDFDVVDRLGKAEVETVKTLRDKKSEEMLMAEFPTLEQVEANREARRDKEASAKRQAKISRKKTVTKKKAQTRVVGGRQTTAKKGGGRGR